LRPVDGLVRDTTTLVRQTPLASGLRRHEGVVRTSVLSAARAGDEPVPAPAYWRANGAVVYRDPDGRGVGYAPWV